MALFSPDTRYDSEARPDIGYSFCSRMRENAHARIRWALQLLFVRWISRISLDILFISADCMKYGINNEQCFCVVCNSLNFDVSFKESQMSPASMFYNYNEPRI